MDWNHGMNYGMDYRMDDGIFMYSRWHHFKLCSSFFCPSTHSDLRRTSFNTVRAAIGSYIQNGMLKLIKKNMQVTLTPKTSGAMHEHRSVQTRAG